MQIQKRSQAAPQRAPRRKQSQRALRRIARVPYKVNRGGKSCAIIRVQWALAQWRVAGRRVAAAAGVLVYKENNRGGCFDARCSAAVSKTHRQCRK